MEKVIRKEEKRPMMGNEVTIRINEDVNGMIHIRAIPSNSPFYVIDVKALSRYHIFDFLCNELKEMYK